MSENFNNRYYARKAAQERKYNIAERRLLGYINDKETSYLNKYLAYNDLIFYSYKQLTDNKELIDTCLNYCMEQIKLFPILKDQFKKFDYDFENEYIVGIDVAFILYRFKKDKESASKLLGELVSFFEGSKSRTLISDIAFQINNDSFIDDVDLNEIESVFQKQRKIMMDNYKKQVGKQEEEESEEENKKGIGKIFKKIKSRFK